MSDDAQARHRANIVREVVKTEESYVDALRTLVEEYSNPLQGAIDRGHPIISQQSHDAIFKNIDIIYSFNEMLLQSLKAMSDAGQVRGRRKPKVEANAEQGLIRRRGRFRNQITAHFACPGAA